MPQLAPVFVGLATALGTTTSGLALGLFAIGGKVALSVYQRKRAKKAARASNERQDIQQNFSQGAVTRWVTFGVAYVAGAYLWRQSRDTRVIVGTILSDDVIDRVIAFYVRGIECLVDANRYVVTPPFNSATGKYVRFEVKYGYRDQTASALLRGLFPDVVTANHVGSGIAYLVTEITQPPEKEFQNMFNGTIPEVGALVAGLPVYDPRDRTQDADIQLSLKHSTNMALIALRYMSHPNGANWSRSIIDINTVARTADHCDELVPLKNGALRKRYEGGGVWHYDEEPASVLDKMFDTFAGRLYVTERGMFGMSCDGLDKATVTITDRDVLRLSVKTGPGALYAANVIRTKFTSDGHGYLIEGEEADPWIDEAAVKARGKQVPTSFDLPYVYRHDQARRLMKQEFYRLNPDWDIEMDLSVAGLQLFGESVCRFVYSLLGIDQDFRIVSFGMEPGNKAKFTARLQSISPKAKEWNPALEEGTAPAPAPATAEDLAPQVPTELGAVPGTARTLVHWHSVTTGKTQEARYSPAGANTWTTVSVTSTARGTMLSGLSAGASYDFQVRVVDSKYGASDWATITWANTALGGSTSALAEVGASGSVSGIYAYAIQPSSPVASEVEFTLVAHGAAVSWSGSTMVSAGPGQMAELSIAKPAGSYDLYARSIGINYDAGPSSGPINVVIAQAVSGSGTSGSESGAYGSYGGSGTQDQGGYSTTVATYSSNSYDQAFGGSSTGGQSTGGIY